MILSGLVWGYYHLTNKGTLGIDCHDPTVEVEVKQNGQVLYKLNRDQRIQLQVGDYDVTVLVPEGTHNGKSIWVTRPVNGRISIRRSETETVTVYPNSTVSGQLPVESLPKRP